MFLLDFRTIVQILLHKHHQWPSRKYRYDSSLIAGHANLINCHPDIIDNLLTTHNIFHFRFSGELLQRAAVVLFSRLQLSKISKNVFQIFRVIFINISDQCLLIQTTSELFYRYTWAMDTGRLSLTLCEAIVEEHSQPEEVNLSNSNSFKVMIP